MAFPLVEFKAFNYRYPGNLVFSLSNIDLVIQEGDFIGLTGPTGAGKTTLIKAINGIIPHFEGGAFSGQVLLNGQNSRELSPGQISRSVGTVMDDPEAQIICLDVEQEMAFGLENMGIPSEEMEERISTALATVGIADLRGRSTNSLSGGQKQRLAIAVAIALRPRVLVLDEPTSELDPLGSRQVYQVLRELNQKYGIAIVVAEQKTELLAEVCKELLVLQQGEIVISGSPAEVFTNEQLLSLGVGMPDVTMLALKIKRNDAVIPVTLEQGLEYCLSLLGQGRKSVV